MRGELSWIKRNSWTRLWRVSRNSKLRRWTGMGRRVWFANLLYRWRKSSKQIERPFYIWWCPLVRSKNQCVEMGNVIMNFPKREDWLLHRSLSEDHLSAWNAIPYYDKKNYSLNSFAIVGFFSLMPDLKKQFKICSTCRLPFHNRKKWESRGIWEHVKYCSDKCRKSRNKKDADLPPKNWTV